MSSTRNVLSARQKVTDEEKQQQKANSRKKLEEFKRVKEEKRKEETAKKPIWKAAGKAPGIPNIRENRPVTRSMTRRQTQSAPNIHEQLKGSSRIATKKISPRSEANKENAEPQKKPVKRVSKIEEKPPTSKSELPKPQIKSSLKMATPVPSGLTPIRRSLEKVIIDDNQSDLEKKLNLKYWRKYQSEQKMIIETALKKLKEIDSSNVTPFWEEQLRVVVAEGELLTGRKSRLHKFSVMIEKPDDVEGGLGIATEDDLKSYWEAQIGPVVTDWSAKSNWLLRAGKLNFPDTERDSMPKPNIGKSPAKPRVKPIDHLGRRASESDPEKAALAEKKKAQQKEKAIAVKKAAEERRKKMKEMMAEKRRQLSSTSVEQE